jgi:glycosyltransferase involved in cell wall biosynthesis
MRVLAVTHSLGANGAALCLCRVLIAIKAAGGSADVVYSGNERLASYLRDHGVGIIEQAQTSQYDVALVNTLIDHHRVAQLAPALPVVFWVHEGPSTRDNGMGSAPGWMQAFRLSSRLVFDTDWQPRTVFKSFLDGVAPHRVLTVAPFGHIPPEARGELHPKPAGRRIVALGSVYPRKRPADLVAAVLRLGDPQAHCTLVGNLDYLHLNGQAMLDAIAQHPQRVTLAGEVTDEQKLQLLREAHVFCSASGDETFGMAPVEAASMGLPLALSDLPCYEGIWQHGVNALLAPVGAVDCLSWNLKALTQDPQLAARLGQAAQKTAGRFTLDRFLRNMSDALVQAIQDPQQPSAF